MLTRIRHEAPKQNSQEKKVDKKFDRKFDFGWINNKKDFFVRLLHTYVCTITFKWNNLTGAVVHMNRVECFCELEPNFLFGSM
jgi:hypothetical protein